MVVSERLVPGACPLGGGCRHAYAGLGYHLCLHRAKWGRPVVASPIQRLTTNETLAGKLTPANPQILYFPK